MSFAIIDNGSARELSPHDNVDLGGGRHTSYGTILVWSDADRAAHGIYPIVEPPVAPRETSMACTGLAVNGTTVTRQVTTTERLGLADLKALLSRELNATAEGVRGRYLTPGAGMAMTYVEKHLQARAVNQLGETSANALSEAERNEQFPTLAASIGIEAPTLWACAQLVMAKYEAFADLSRVIEATRLAGLKAIKDATTHDGARAAAAAVTWTV